MVVAHSFQDVFDVSSKSTSLSLPIIKQNPLKLKFENSDASETVFDGPEPILPFARSGVFHGRISNWRRLTAIDERCKAVYEITIDITGSNFTFKTGDTVGIIPHNHVSEVDAIIQHLGLTAQADLAYSLAVEKCIKSKIPAHVPVESTLRHLLTNCLDLRSVVKKLFILALSKYTKNESQRKALEYLCSKEGSTAYTTHILNKNLCVLDVFALFDSCLPPIEVLIAHLPRLLPRPYSIVNSGLKEPNILKICFSVMDLGNNRKGLTTGWMEQIVLENNSNIENRLKNLSLNDEKYKSYDCRIPFYMRKNMSGFSLPEDVHTPLLLIGPGTGVSPFIGFLEEREKVTEHHDLRTSLGKVWLFFGCRNPKLDFIYEKELKEFVLNGTLSELRTAFSRVENSEIKYIQDALLKSSEDVAKLLADGAAIFLCGDLKTMVLQIRETLEKCLMEHNDKSHEEAEKFITEMQRAGRYFVDIWS